MNREDIGRLLYEAWRLTHHEDFVIIGSLSILGAVRNPPVSMTGSIDVDLYPKNDPNRASEIADALGLGSDFERMYGYYADAVSPMLPTLPEGWYERLVPVEFESGIRAWFLEPQDAAISKYARSEPRDRDWIRAGLEARILSLPTIDYRMRETVMETDERQRARTAIDEDRQWFTLLNKPKIARIDKSASLGEIKQHAASLSLRVVENTIGAPLAGPVLSVNDFYFLQSAGRGTARVHDIDALKLTSDQGQELVVGAPCEITYRSSGESAVAIHAQDKKQGPSLGM